MKADGWELFGALPNIRCQSAVEWRDVALVPPSDARIHAMLAASPGLKKFFYGFRNQFGREIEVSFILFRHGGISERRIEEAVVDFRNSLAIVAIVRGWAQTLVSVASVPRTLYSDSFAFYPYSVSKDPSILINHNPALRAIDLIDEFSGQMSAELTTVSFDIERIDDPRLTILKQKWESRYFHTRGRSKTTSLFRSLQVAFHAFDLPVKNRNSLHDVGIGVALFISAIEILVHPGRSGRADLTKALRLFNSLRRARSSTLAKRWRVPVAGVRVSCNLCAKLYARLYAIRNAFLHGNPVEWRHLHFGRPKYRQAPWTASALLYGRALDAVLGVQLLDSWDDFLAGNWIRRGDEDEALRIVAGLTMGARERYDGSTAARPSQK